MIWIVPIALSLTDANGQSNHKHEHARPVVRAAVSGAHLSGRAEPDTVITVRTIGTDLSYDMKEITLRTGVVVRFDYVNEGTMPHNMVFVRSRDDIDPVGIAALNAFQFDYIPPGMEDRMVAYTAVAYPDETVSVTFTVPPAGEYPYICTFPGHFRAMQGFLRSVE